MRYDILYRIQIIQRLGGTMKAGLVYENLPISSMNPVVLYSQIFYGNEGYAMGEALAGRCVRDYELEYFIDSKGSMYINEERIPIQKGDIVFRRPGQYTQGIMPYSCYFISFNMTNTPSSDNSWYQSCEWEREEVKFQTYYTNAILDHIPTIFHIEDEEKYYSLFEAVFHAYLNPIPGSEILMKASVLNILYQLYQDSCNPINTMLHTPYGKALNKAIDFINNNFHQKLSLQQLSELAGLSPNYFHKIFTQIMKITPNEYISTVRLNKAKELLLKTNLQIYHIADQCGFNNVSYFSFLFKKTYHITPVDFRNRYSYVNYGMNKT
jgi:AraC family transcriptional regulator